MATYPAVPGAVVVVGGLEGGLLVWYGVVLLHQGCYGEEMPHPTEALATPSRQ